MILVPGMCEVGLEVIRLFSWHKIKPCLYEGLLVDAELGPLDAVNIRFMIGENRVSLKDVLQVFCNVYHYTWLKLYRVVI